MVSCVSDPVQLPCQPPTLTHDGAVGPQRCVIGVGAAIHSQHAPASGGAGGVQTQRQVKDQRRDHEVKLVGQAPLEFAWGGGGRAGSSSVSHTTPQLLSCRLQWLPLPLPLHYLRRQHRSPGVWME